MRLLYSFLMIIATPSLASTSFHPLFSDNAILQRNTAVQVKAYSTSDTQLTLKLDGKTVGAAKAEGGHWALTLPAQPAGGPHKLELEGDSDTVSISNVYFGDVFLASGQSNMELTMARVEEAYPNDVNRADYPLIREFTVPDTYNFNGPQETISPVGWQTAQSDNIRSLSAIAYYFARNLYRHEGVPIGIVNASLGGSPIEAWMPLELLGPYPVIKAKASVFKSDAAIARVQASDAQIAEQWYSTLFNEDQGLSASPTWFSPELNTDSWPVMHVPGPLPDSENGYAGIWWARNTFTLKNVPDAPVTLRLGRIKDADEVWVNGEKVGNTTYQYPPRAYTVSADLLRTGSNTVAIRITANNQATGFVEDKPYFVGNSKMRVSLAGEWRYKRATKASQPAPEQTFIRWQPTGLYNAMIAPIQFFPISGVLWYQGESNADSPANYADKLTAMMENWRDGWQSPELPLFIVQLAGFMNPQTGPEESSWARLRLEQASAAEHPFAHLVTTLDAGEWNDIHPVNKRVVGERLANQARHVIYNSQVNHSGPVVTHAEAQGNEVRLTLTDKDGLHVTGEGPAGFSIRGEEGTFYMANARFSEGTLTLSHPEVAKPTQVRYAYANNPIYSIVDGDGWPMAPFELTLH